MLNIGTIKIPSRLILAPMAGISDSPFRLLNRQFGCECAFVEMINARAISSKNKKTRSMLVAAKEDRPLGIQLLGSHEEYLMRALEVLKAYHFDFLDFNAACPQRKVVRREEGAALLKDLKKLNALLRCLVKHSSKPVTVKIRSGWDKDVINSAESARAAEDAGVAAVFIHGRTREQLYRGHVDFEPIRQAKKAVKIPVVASGDIWSAQHAKKMFDETGCDGVLIARGALGNPWIFKQTKAFLKKGELIPRPSVEEIRNVMFTHFQMCKDFYGDKMWAKIFRKFFIWYTAGLPHTRHLREKVSFIRSEAKILELFDEFERVAHQGRPTDVYGAR